MGEESQVHPLASSQFHPRSDEEYAARKPTTGPSRKTTGKCFVYLLTFLVILGLASLVFSLVVLKVRPPELRLRSAAVKRLGFATWPAAINAAVAAEIEVKNENFGRLLFEGGNVTVLCGNVTVGTSSFGPGRVLPRAEKRVRAALEVRSNGWLAENGNFTRDVGSGTVELRGYARLTGRIRVLKMINKRRSAEMNCTMRLDLGRKTIQDLRCL
ncbi:hypothetical protein NMG60_11030494 [Bertholletia excelsa]